jgi:hypothetical protein
MENIRKIISENQEEFNQMVINFIESKNPKAVKQKKKPKTICHFSALGKEYDSDIFTNNYTDFLKDISNIHGVELFKQTIGTFFVKDNIREFTDNTKSKSSIINLNQGGYVSCYSSTSQKMEHINEITKKLKIPVVFQTK